MVRIYIQIYLLTHTKKNNTMDISHFGMFIKNIIPTNPTNLENFTKNFPLDIKTNKSNTALYQISNNKLISPSNIYLCNKSNNEIPKPTGYTQTQYYKKLKDLKSLNENLQELLITNPPVGPIPIGAWCKECSSIGPKFHSMECLVPNDSSLCFTLLGIIECLKNGNKGISNEQYGEFFKEINSTMSSPNKQISISKESKYFTQQTTPDKWPMLNIPCNKIIKKSGPTTNKKTTPFPNTTTIRYVFPQTYKQMYCKVSKNLMIHIVTCPWERKDFYKDVIGKVSDVVGVDYIPDPGDSFINNVFGSGSLYDKKVQMDFDMVYNWIGSNTQEYTRIFERTKKKINSKYLYFKQKYYKYTIDYQKQLATPKIILKLTPTNTKNQMPYKTKPYKITIILFTSGKTQLIWSRCDQNDELCDVGNVLNDIEDQFDIIQNSLQDVWDFMVDFITTRPDLLINQQNIPTINKKSKYINTVKGIAQYKKKEKFNKNTKVQYYNEQTQTWEEPIGIVDSVRGGVYNVVWPHGVDFPDSFEGSDLLRSTEQSPMVINKKDEGPNPYSFRGKCTDEDKFVPMGGTRGYDNLYYPACVKKTSTKYKMYIDHILNGFPQNESEEDEFQLVRGQPDSYTGILKQKKNDIGSTVIFRDSISGDRIRGKILDRSVSGKKGKNNYVIYTVETEDGERMNIRGSDFVLDERESREWEGLGKDAKRKLIRCSEKLGLTRSSYLKEYEERKVQKMVINKLKKLLPNNREKSFTQTTTVLTTDTIRNLTRHPYMAISLPKNAERILLYVDEGSGMYLVNEYNQVMNLRIPTKLKTTILDGFMYDNIYYPIDCLYFNQQKQSGPYINRNTTNNDSDPDSDSNSDSDSDSDDDSDSDSDDSDGGYRRRRRKRKNGKRGGSGGIKNMGRLYLTLYVSSLLKGIVQTQINFSSIENMIAPRITDLRGNITPRSIVILTKNNLIRDLSKLQHNNILFVPQIRGNYIQWKPNLSRSIVLEVIHSKRKTKVQVGIAGKYLQPWGDMMIEVPGRSNQRYIRFNLNMVHTNDKKKLVREEPIILDKKEPWATVNDLYTYQKTQSIINIMLKPIDQSMFNNSKEWILPSNRIITTQDIRPGIQPLVFRN